MLNSNKPRILIDSGFLLAKDLKELVCQLESLSDIRIVYARPCNSSRWGNNDLPEISTSYEYIETIQQEDKGNITDNYIDSFVELLNDHRSLLLSERNLNHEYGASVFHQVRRLEKMYFGSLNYIARINPDYLLFLATPHNPRTWALAKAAEHAKIPVLVIEATPIPWRFWVMAGIDERTLEPQLSCNKKNYNNELAYQEASHFIDEKNKSYGEAIPQYEKVRLDARRGKYWSWRKEIREHKFHILKLIRKKLLLNSYYRFATFTLPEFYVVFFLHFQPERTTIPEGFNFAQQWLAIRALSLALPDGCKLIVKEHPATYTNLTDERYRDKSFYEDIATLPNVLITPLETDTFELIDGACAISTITGYVGVEALTRGTPVIIFGNASYRDAPSVYFVKNEREISKALDDILNFNKKNKIKTDMEKYLSWVVENSTSGLEYGEIDFKGDIDKVARPRGHLRLIKMIINRIAAGEKLQLKTK